MNNKGIGAVFLSDVINFNFSKIYISINFHGKYIG